MRAFAGPRAVLASLVAFGALVIAAPVWAQPAGDSRAAGFRAVEGANVEDVPGGMLLVAAYGIAWLLVLAFVWRLAGLQRQAGADLARVEAALEARGSDRES